MGQTLLPSGAQGPSPLLALESDTEEPSEATGSLVRNMSRQLVKAESEAQRDGMGVGLRLGGWLAGWLALPGLRLTHGRGCLKRF